LPASDFNRVEKLLLARGIVEQDGITSVELIDPDLEVVAQCIQFALALALLEQTQGGSKQFLLRGQIKGPRPNIDRN
jgi:hypothetical protein